MSGPGSWPMKHQPRSVSIPAVLVQSVMVPTRSARQDWPIVFSAAQASVITRSASSRPCLLISSAASAAADMA